MILLFNNQEQLIRVVKSDAIRVLEHTQALTDEQYVSDKLYTEIKALDDAILNEVEYMAIPVADETYQHHYFWVQSHTTEHDITTLQGVQAGIEELRKTPLFDERPTDQSLRDSVNQILKGTNWQTGYVADVGRRSIRLYYTDVFTALKRICELWNVEMQFFIEVTNESISARYIDFKKRIGVNNGARVVYGHNALQILKEEEKTELYTALIGRGKGEEVSDGSQSESGQAGYGRKINFADVQWRKADGDPVDKPLGQQYVEIPEATALYGIKGKPKFGFVEFSDEEDKRRLLELTYEELERLSRPQVTFKTSSVYVKGNIGDVIRVARPDKNMDYNVRIFEIKWDRLTNQAVDIKLGDRLDESDSKRESRITNNAISGAVDEVTNNVSGLIDYVVSANGFNRNYYTSERPQDLGYDVKINDQWYQPDPDSEGDYILYIWNGEFWEELIRTRGISEATRKVEELSKQADDFAQDLTSTSELANEVNNKAIQLEQNYQDVKASTDSAMNKAVDAYTDAQSALAGIDGLVYENRNLFSVTAWKELEPKPVENQVPYLPMQLEPSTDYTVSVWAPEYEDEVTMISATNTSEVIRWAANNINHLESRTVRTLDDGILKIGSNRDLTSGEFEIKVEKGTKATPYSVAPEDLNEGIANAWRVANEALSDVENLDQSVRQEFTNIDGRLSSKAEQTTVNEINRTVQNQGSELLQAQNMISLKADQTDVDTLNQIIETNSAELSVLAGEISAKADKMIVDNLNQSVETLSAEQIVQAGMISERLTRTEVNSEIERRVNDMAGGEFNLEGYAQVDYVENLIENTADSFTQSIENVRKLVPTEYENRNLVEDSREFRQLPSLTYLQRANITEVNDKVSVDDTVTISFDVTADADIPDFRVFDSNRSIDKAIGVIRLNNTIKAGTHRYSNTVTVADGGRGSDEWVLDFYNQNDGIYFEVDNLKIEKGTVATDWSPAPEDLQNDVTILRSDYERTAEEVTDRLTKIDGNNGYISEIRRDVGSLTSSITEYEEGTAQRFNVIESDVNSNRSLIADLERDTESRFSQADQEMSLLVRSSDLISEINVQADRQIFRVGDNRLMITEDTTYLDNAVIKSAHISDLAVTGAKIADASISSAKIINLDVDKLSGNTTNFIQSSWNSINSWMTATGNGIEMVGDNQWRRNILTARGIDLYDRSGAYNKAGVIGYFVPHSTSVSQEVNSWITTRIGTPKHGIGIGANYHHDIVLGYEYAEQGGSLYMPALEVRGTTGDVDISTRLIMKNGGNIIDVNTLKYNQLNTEIGSWDGSLTYRANRNHRFFSSNNQELFNIQDNGYANLYARLNMHGHDVYNQSDERLKRNIMPSFKDSLGKFNKLEFKWFEYLENRGLADGLHHGVMAQDVLKFAPEWVIEDEQGYYSLNQSAMLMDAFKAIMQLSQKVKKLEAK